MQLPIKVTGGVESNKFLRKDFEFRHPNAVKNGLSFDDMRAFVKRLEHDDDLRAHVSTDIWEVTCPCYDNTTLKSHINLQGFSSSCSKTI